MEFNFELGLKEISYKTVVCSHRIAVRAIIMLDGLLLMVQNNKGDVKLPGGGVMQGETHYGAIRREVKEETGYTVSKINELIGAVKERKEDIYKEDTVFEMTSYYYLCMIDEEREELEKFELDDYEKDLGFVPVWLSIKQAIKINESVLKENNDINTWIIREIEVLKRLDGLF